MKVTANGPKRSTSTLGATPPAGGATALAANFSRVTFSIQNLGTNPLYLRFGSGASLTNFDVIVAAGAANDDGKGGFYSDDTYTGIVTVAGTTPRYVASERP